MKNRLKTFLTVITLTMIAATCVFAGCGKGENPSAVKVFLDRTEIELTVGETYTLTADVKNAENAEIVWTTSDSAIATVQDGTVRAVAAGSTTVKAAVGDAFASCAVTVVPKGEVSISLDKTELVMQTGDAPTVLYADVRNEPDDADVEWRSSDVSVVTVLGGRVSVIGAGTATIIAEIAGKSAACEITVLAFNPQIILAQESLNLLERESVRMSVEVQSHGRTETGVIYEWESENENVATVDAGYVTAVYEGSTTITVIARTDGGRINVFKTIPVTVSARTVTFKVNRMIENAEGEWVKDGEKEQFTCKEGDEYVLEKIWSYKGLLINTSKLAEEGQYFNGFGFAEDGSSEINAYYSAAVPVAESEGKAFLAFTPNHSANPAHIGGTFAIENAETEVGGKTGAIKLTNTDSARQLLRLVGVNKAWTEEKGFERLSFEFYAENVSATNVVFYIGGYSAASAHIASNMSNLATVVYLYDETGARVYNTVDGKWFRAEIILADTLDAANTAFPAFQIQLACTAGTEFYIRDAKFYTPEYQTYSAEYYFENGSGEFVKDDEISFTAKGIGGDTVEITADVFDGFVFDGANANNVLSATLDGENPVVLKIYYKIARYSSYSVKYYTQNDDGVSYTEQTAAGYTVGNCLEGSAATAEIKTFAGRTLNTYKSVLRGEVLPDNGLTLEVYYDVAVPIANTDGNGYLFTFETGSTMKSGIGGYYSYVGAYQGLNGVYKFTQTVRRGYTAVVGIDQTFVASSEYGYLRFDMFSADTAGTANIVMNLNNGKGGLFSLHSASEVANRGKGIYFFDKATGEALNAFVYGKWITVIIDLDGVQGGNSQSVSRLYLQMGLEKDKEIYFADMTLCNRENADYTVEYYFENDLGEFVKDDARTATFSGEAGLTASAEAVEITDYVFDVENENNVKAGTVLADGSLVLKLYYAKIKITSYSVRYWLQDGVSYTENAAAGYTVNDATIGTTVNAEQKNFAGYYVNTVKAETTLSGVVAKDGALILDLYYDVAVPVANTEDKAAFFTFTSSTGKSGESGAKFAYVGDYQGLSDVYSFTQVARREYIRIVGIDKQYGLNAGYTKVKFNMYIPLAEGEVVSKDNIVMNLNNGTGLFSAWNPSEVKNKRLTIIDAATGGALNAVVGNRWMTLIADLSDLGSSNNLTPRIHFEIGGNAGMVVYMQGATLYTPQSADYTVEYYLENDLGEFVKDDARTATLSGTVGFNVSAEPITIADYTFDAENENNVKVGTVLADGSLVLKLYYKQEAIRNYDVEYYLRQNDGTYAKSATLSETLSGAKGTTVNAEIKNVGGYIYSMRNPNQVLSATLADSGTVLKVYYDNGIAITDDGGNTVAILAGELYGANIADMGTSVELAADKTITNGTEKIYSHVVTQSGTLVKLMPFGISRADAVAAGYKKLSMKIYVTSDVSIDRIYQMAKYTDAGLKEYRINSGNMTGNAYVRVFNESGERVYDFASDYEGWITVEYLIGSTIDGYGIADTVNDSSVINSGIYIAAYITTSGNSVNLNKPVYISEVKLSTADLSDSLA